MDTACSRALLLRVTVAVLTLTERAAAGDLAAQAEMRALAELLGGVPG